jgi:hypothetical protein
MHAAIRVFCAANVSADYCTSTSVQREPNRSLCTEQGSSSSREPSSCSSWPALPDADRDESDPHWPERLQPPARRFTLLPLPGSADGQEMPGHSATEPSYLTDILHFLAPVLVIQAARDCQRAATLIPDRVPPLALVQRVVLVLPTSTPASPVAVVCPSPSATSVVRGIDPVDPLTRERRSSALVGRRSRR